MTPIEASALFATLVGLICNWKQERATQAADRYQDFMAWLMQHNFNSISERIYDSEELQRELTALLHQDLSVLSSKLDIITGAISAVGDKIDFLSQVSHALGVDKQSLSEQAAEILKVFDQLGASRMIFSDMPLACVFMPGNKVVQFSETRFMETDVAALESMGFTKLVDHNTSGNPIYAITRAGTAFAATQPEVAL